MSELKDIRYVENKVLPEIKPEYCGSESLAITITLQDHKTDISNFPFSHSTSRIFFHNNQTLTGIKPKNRYWCELK